MDLLQIAPGIKAEFAGQSLLQSPEGGQGLDALPRRVQGEHQEAYQRLSQRKPVNKSTKFGGDVVVAQRQFQCQALLPDGQMPVLPDAGRALQPAAPDTGQHFAAPQQQRLTQLGGRRGDVHRDQFMSGGRQLVESVRVQGIALQAEKIPGAPGRDDVAGGAIVEQLPPKSRNDVLDLPTCRCRRLLPDDIDQMLDGHSPVGAQQECGECPLLP